METRQLHRGRLIDHLQPVVTGLPAARRAYPAVLEPLRAQRGSGADRLGGARR